MINSGITFLPEKLGKDTSQKNSYGTNFYIGSGLIYNFSKNKSIYSYINYPMGPGDNYFDQDLNYSRKLIYSFGVYSFLKLIFRDLQFFETGHRLHSGLIGLQINAPNSIKA